MTVTPLTTLYIFTSLHLSRDHCECSEIRIINSSKNILIQNHLKKKKWQWALGFSGKNSWNMACGKCARWPSCRRCRGGINLIRASNIHLANISRLETQAQKRQARLAGSHNGGWQMTVIHERRPDIYRIYIEKNSPFHISDVCRICSLACCM